MIWYNKPLITQVLIVLVASLLFIPFLGQVPLFDWDEINFAESAREMIVSGDYLTVQINFQPFWEKPPLFIWMQVLSMKIFGINEFAARFPNAVCGIISLLVLFSIGKRVYSERFGLLWVLVYAGSILPHFYFKSGIIDPWFNLFIFLGIYFFILFTDKHQKGKNMARVSLSALFIGLAILTKGPVAFLIFVLCFLVFWVINRFRLKVKFSEVFVYAIVLILTGGFWFILQIMNGNFDVVIDFIQYQIRLFNTKDAGHGGFAGYHVVVLFFGVFPASVIALKGFIRKKDDSISQIHFKKWMLILFWVVLILFSIVRTKIVHYSSLCYFPLSFLATYMIYKLIKKKTRWLYGVMNPLILFTALIISFITAGIGLIERYKERIIDSGWINDPFAIASLNADVNWGGYEFILGIFLFTGVVISMFLFRHKYRRTGFVLIFIVGMIYTNLTILLLVPKIEQYSQHASIEFYENIRDEDCYIETLGFKSYAHLFYTRKKIPENKRSYEKHWLLTGRIDKTAYFITKIQKAEKYENKYPVLIKLYEKNGFVFYKREPEKKE